jgi:ParB-like chromosome segregation protein Spo0J
MSEVTNAVIDIDKIKPHSENYNSHPESQIQQLGMSYRSLDQYRSVVVWQQPDGSYIQLAGHGIVEAMRREGATEVRADIWDATLDPMRAKQIMLADNLHAQNSEPDDTLLVRLLEEQRNAGFDLTAFGTDDEALRQMLESLGTELLDGAPDVQFREYDESIEEGMDTELCDRCGRLCLKTGAKSERRGAASEADGGRIVV